MKHLNPLVTIVGLILVSFQAAAFPVRPSLPQLRSTPPPQATSHEVVQATIEKSLGLALSEDQKQSLRLSTETIESSPRQVVFGRSETFLVCVSATLAYIGKLQVGVCSDMSGNPYYIQMVGLGAVWGAAGQVFVFAAMHDSDQGISPRFTVGAVGGTAAYANKVYGLLKGLTQIAPLVGPDVGLFHSIWGNQAGVLVGVNVGKIVGIDASNMIIHDTLSQLVSTLWERKTDLTWEEYEARIEARKIRLGLK